MIKRIWFIEIKHENNGKDLLNIQEWSQTYSWLHKKVSRKIKKIVGNNGFVCLYYPGKLIWAEYTRNPIINSNFLLRVSGAQIKIIKCINKSEINNKWVQSLIHQNLLKPPPKSPIKDQIELLKIYQNTIHKGSYLDVRDPQKNIINIDEKTNDNLLNKVEYYAMNLNYPAIPGMRVNTFNYNGDILAIFIYKHKTKGADKWEKIILSANFAQ